MEILEKSKSIDKIDIKRLQWIERVSSVTNAWVWAISASSCPRYIQLAFLSL